MRKLLLAAFIWVSVVERSSPADMPNRDKNPGKEPLADDTFHARCDFAGDLLQIWVSELVIISRSNSRTDFIFYLMGMADDGFIQDAVFIRAGLDIGTDGYNSTATEGKPAFTLHIFAQEQFIGT